MDSAIMDHAVKDNHVTDCESMKIVDKEGEDQAKGIKEAVYTCIWIYHLVAAEYG